MKDMELMTPYEKRIISGIGRTKGDAAREDSVVADSIRKVLGMSVVMSGEDGTVADVSLMDAVVAKKVAYDLEHPERIDLIAYRKAMGEDVSRSEVQVRTAADFFSSMVVETDETE